MDVLAVRKRSEKRAAVEAVRMVPLSSRCRTYRFVPFDVRYRVVPRKEEVEQWKKRDPIGAGHDCPRPVRAAQSQDLETMEAR